MCTTLVAFTLAVLVSADPPARSETPRKPNPLAPSLPELTEEEENKLDEIINRFTDYDSGKVRGGNGKQIVKDFQKLGPEAIPALIRGLNRAAKIEHSCPAVTIAKKLARMLSASKDTELLEFARENVGAGVTQSRHMGVIKDLRVLCMLQKRAVDNAATAAADSAPALKGKPAPGGDSVQKGVREMTITELVEASGKDRGRRLKMVLTELGTRRGDEAIGALGAAAASYDGETRKLARDLLTRQLSSLSGEALKDKLKDDRAEVRAAAASVAANKKYHLESELIDLLADDETSVRQAAHRALVRISKGTDFGPKAGATEAERKQAEQKWRAWLAKQSDR